MCCLFVRDVTRRKMTLICVGLLHLAGSARMCCYNWFDIGLIPCPLHRAAVCVRIRFCFVEPTANPCLKEMAQCGGSSKVSPISNEIGSCLQGSKSRYCMKAMLVWAAPSVALRSCSDVKVEVVARNAQVLSKSASSQCIS